MTWGLKLLGLSLTICLAACTAIEHRSDALTPTVLAPLAHNLDMHLLWRRQFGAGSRYQAPLRLVQKGQLLLGADSSGHVLAMDTQGRLLWERALKQAITAGPAVGEKTLVLGLADASVLSLNLQDGHQLWRSPLSSEILASPSFGADSVYCHTLDGGIRAYRALDAHLMWQFQASAPVLQLRRAATPFVNNEQVIAAFANGRVVALDPISGEVQWEQEIAHAHGQTELQRMRDISASPIVHNKTVYVVGYHGPLTALSTDDGSHLWEKPYESYNELTLHQNRLFVSDIKGQVSALDPETGEALWQQTALKGRRLTSVVPQGAYLVTADSEGYLHWLDAKTGVLKGRLLLDKAGFDTRPVVDKNKIYVLSTKGKLYAYEIKL